MQSVVKDDVFGSLFSEGVVLYIFMQIYTLRITRTQNILDFKIVLCIWVYQE